MNLRELIKSAIFTAILCAISPFTIPLGVIPVSLCSFGVYLSAIILKPLYATLSVLLYVAIGILGVPVFSGANGGVGVIIGPTGGFVFGYIICALLVSVLKSRTKTTVALIFGTFVLYVCGVVWFSLVTKNSLFYAFIVCVLPFLLGDAVKIAIATVAGEKINKRLQKNRGF